MVSRFGKRNQRSNNARSDFSHSQKIGATRVKNKSALGLVQERTRYKQWRLNRWEAGFRPRCRAHPDRVVSKSSWVSAGNYRCASCNNKRPSGVTRPAYVKYRAHRPLSTPAVAKWRVEQKAKIFTNWGEVRV